MSWFTNSSTIGVNLGNSDGASALFGLGSKILGSNNSEWMYCCVSTTSTTGQMMMVGLSFTATPATLTGISGSASVGPQRLAFAQGNFTANDFGWLAVRGDAMQVALSSSSTLGLPLYMSTTDSGHITTITGTMTVAGVLYQSVSATAVLNASIQAFITWPRINQLLSVGAAGGSLG